MEEKTVRAIKNVSIMFLVFSLVIIAVSFVGFQNVVGVGDKYNQCKKILNYRMMEGYEPSMESPESMLLYDTYKCTVAVGDVDGTNFGMRIAGILFLLFSILLYYIYLKKRK